MEHFQRWLKGLVEAVLGMTLAFFGSLISLSLTVYVHYVFGLFVLLSIASGFYIYLHGKYIMEEEKPRGRFRIE